LFSGLVAEEWWKVGLLSVGGPCTAIQYSKTDRGLVTVKITVRLGGGEKKDGFSEHNQQTFTIETMMTAHAYIVPSHSGMTSFLSLSSYLVVICFTFAFG